MYYHVYSFSLKQKNVFLLQSDLHIYKPRVQL